MADKDDNENLTERVAIRCSKGDLARLEEIRRREPGLPSAGKAIRLLIDRAFTALPKRKS